MTSTAIVWFRNDLRLADNPTLDHAREHYERIVPVFIRNPDREGDRVPGASSRWWRHHSLNELDERLRKRSSRLNIATGYSARELQKSAMPRTQRRCTGIVATSRQWRPVTRS